MLKTEARKAYKIKRASLNDAAIEEQSIAIANQFLKLKQDILSEEKIYFHLFLSIEQQKEINTEHFLNILFAKNKEIVVSKSNFENNTLTNYLLTENTRLQTNKYGIPEPIDGIEVPISKLHVVFVPLLAYDKQGNRVGYGKGFYDNFLSETDAIKIGLSFFEPEDKIEDISSNDIALDYCITPKNIHSFKR